MATTTLTTRFARHWLLVALLVAIAASSATVAIIGLTAGIGESKSAPAIRVVPAPVGDLYQGGYAERRQPVVPQHVSAQPKSSATSAFGNYVEPRPPFASPSPRTAESSPQVPGHRP